MSLFLKKKRAQAAVELLTTYGWAIMGVILVIGALSYFDVFDAKRFVSERCDTGSQIQCIESYANNGGEFQISLRNNYLVDIVVESIYVDGAELGYMDDPTSCAGAIPQPISMNSGNISKFCANVTDLTGAELVKGDKKDMDLVITFRRDAPGYNSCADATCYNVSGTLVTKVQDVSFGIVPKTD